MPMVTIQAINVNGVMNAEDVGTVITEALPQALNRAISTSGRGAAV